MKIYRHDDLAYGSGPYYRAKPPMAGEAVSFIKITEVEITDQEFAFLKHLGLI